MNCFTVLVRQVWQKQNCEESDSCHFSISQIIILKTWYQNLSLFLFKIFLNMTSIDLKSSLKKNKDYRLYS